MNPASFRSLTVKHRKAISTSLCYSAAIITFAIIWLPVVEHYYVSNEHISADVIRQARMSPSDDLLKEITPFFSRVEEWEDQYLLESAEGILQGQVKVPERPLTAITLPFDGDDLGSGLPDWQMVLASLRVPEVLLEAYLRTQREEFLTLAREMIVGFGRYESRAWVPTGLVWNDHAVSAHVFAMAKFWRLYRNHPSYDHDTAATLFQLVSRSAKMLSKPSHFQSRTNHGVMQNLALLEICVAFPTLSRIEHYRQTALERLQIQMEFYVNDEGVVLEHSMFYQNVGVRFVGLAIKYLTMLETPVPEAWKEKYRRAMLVYSQINRPDLSLPVFGDTDHKKYAPPPLLESLVEKSEVHPEFGTTTVSARKQNLVLPVAGYAFWWDGAQSTSSPTPRSQTAFAWSRYVGHAHKHADEMSMVLWADGQRWWTNVGTWKYGTPGRSEATTWRASNAPHLVGEDEWSSRTSSLQYWGNSTDLAVLDLERKGPDDYVARRQAIHLKPEVWLVLDHCRGAKNSQTETVWTTSYDVTTTKSDFPNSYRLSSDKSDSRLTAFFLGDPNLKIQQYRGSYDPFAGWNVLETESIPATSFMITQPAENSWSATVSNLAGAGRAASEWLGPPVISWSGPEEWRCDIPMEGSTIVVRREEKQIHYDRGLGVGAKSLSLIQQADITDRYEKIREGFNVAVTKYPANGTYASYRWKMTYYGLCIFVLQEIFFIIYRSVGGRNAAALRILAVVGWAGIIGMWFRVLMRLT